MKVVYGWGFRIVSNPADDEFYVVIDQRESLDAKTMLKNLDLLGIDLMDEDECESEQISDHEVKVWGCRKDGVY